MKRVLVIHGPNTNLVGYQDPQLFGTATLTQINAELAELGTQWGLEVAVCQSNHEGDLITWIQAAAFGEEIADGSGDVAAQLYDGIIINAGGFAQTSIALRDAVSACSMPVIEVHIANVHAQQDFDSLLGPICKGQVSGLGKESYTAALYAMSKLLV